MNVNDRRNRATKKNNTKENLKLLCANCHNIWHFEDKSGTFKNLKYDKQNRNQKDT